MASFFYNFIAVFIFITLSLPINVNAQEFKPTEEQIQKIKKAEQYLNNIKTLSSEFIQVSPYNSEGDSPTSFSNGKMYLSRPGKARWEYTNPVPQIIIVKDKQLIYYDKELEQVSYLELDGGLSTFLTNEKIDFFSSNFNIISFLEDDGGFSFVIEEKKSDEENKNLNEQLRLVFYNDPMSILRFSFKDVNGRVTTVEFKQPTLDIAIDDELFIFKNPKIGKDAWDTRKN